MYNWNIFTHCISFATKMKKHIASQNVAKVKAYVLVGLDGLKIEEKDSIKDTGRDDAISEGLNFLGPLGWQLIWHPRKATYMLLSPDMRLSSAAGRNLTSSHTIPPVR